MQRFRKTKPAEPPALEGVTHSESCAVFVTGMLEGDGYSVRPGMVAAHMHTTPSALSQILKSLEEKGLIVRSRGGEDFRAVALSLTDAGRAVAAEVDRQHTEHVQKVLEYIGEEDCRHLVATLQKILEYHEREQAALAAGCGQGLQPAPDPAAAPTGLAPDAACAAGSRADSPEGSAPCA